MNKKHALWYKLIALILAVVVLLPILAACGGGEEEVAPTTATPIPTASPAPTSTPASTPTPTTSTEPIKIGAVSVWSGPQAMSGLYYADAVIKLVESQVKQMGGILGGRLVKVVRFDTGAKVSESSAGAIKLVKDDNVSALVFGGNSGAETTATADAAEDLHVLLVSNADIEKLADRKFSVVGVPGGDTIKNDVVRMVEGLKPATVGFLLNDEVSHHEAFDYAKPKLEAAGIKVVYSQFTSSTTTDFTPYLTKIKYSNPDVMVISFLSEGFVTVAKQMMELGGWGDIQVLAYPGAVLATRQPGARGWIVMVAWYPGSDYPASRKFAEEFQAVNGKSPDANHVYFYLCLGTVIHAMELAGTDDPVAIAQAARSGNLVWDTPAGISRISTTGETDLHYTAVQVLEGGKLTPFNP